MEQVLLVEDHLDTAEAIISFMSKNDIIVYHRETAEKALKLLKIRGANSFKLIILDIILPDMNGKDLLRELRELKTETPILMLTTIGDTDNIVETLDAGADDYLTKPFSLAELTARINSLMRRPSLTRSDIIEKGDFKLDRRQKICYYKDEKLDLRKREYDILEFLIIYANQNLTRDYIITNIWGNIDKLPNNNTIDVHIKQLREILGDTEKNIIETIHGIGYKLKI
jgi:DNA-binding response OmpR family regulator